MTLPRVDFPTLGFQVIDWIEAMLVHGPGDVQGQPIEIDDEVALFVLWAYRLNKRGRRIFRRAVLSRPKGRAKSEIAGALVCAEALGPVRCDGFDSNGEPVGRPVTGPFIRCLATEEGQSGNTYDNVVVMLQEGEVANEYPGIDVGLTRTFLPGRGVITPSTASSAAKDGGKETFRVADETHLYVTPELKRMYQTVQRNLGKRKIAEPWGLDTTTSFLPGEESIAESTADQFEGLTPEQMTKKGVLYDHREAPEVKDFHSNPELRKALKEVYGPAAEWLDIKRIIAEIRDPEASEADSRRYWLNQRVKTVSQWVGKDDVVAGRSKERLKKGEQIALGFDGSRRQDSTGLVACRIGDGLLELLAKWEKPEGILGEGWEVNSDEVDAAVYRAFEDYDVVLFYPDQPWWEAEVDGWYTEFGDVVVSFRTNSDARMAPAVRRLEVAFENRTALHTGDPDFERHVLNARRKATRHGDVITKDRPQSPRKIDFAVAAVLAYEARADAITNGLLKRPSGEFAFH